MPVMTDKERRKFDISKWGNRGKGVKCPKCECADTRVQNMRRMNGENQRRRICRHCGYGFGTEERVRK